MRGVLVVLACASALVAPPRPAARRRCRLAAPEKAAEAPAEGLFRGPPELLTVRSEALLVAQAGLVGAATGVAVSILGSDTKLALPAHTPPNTGHSSVIGIPGSVCTVSVTVSTWALSGSLTTTWHVHSGSIST